MGASASRPEPPAHRSLNCRAPTTVELINDTEHTVQTVWLNYRGEGRVYFTLAPGAHVRQPTFTCHPWRFQSPDAPGASHVFVVDDQAFFYPPPKPQPSAAPPQARIVLASRVPWSPRTHAAFPAAFHREAAALLCCHHRLARAARGSGAATAAVPARVTVQEQQQELLLLVLEAAAPSIPLVVKPAVPHSMQPSDLPAEEAAQLFRAASGGGGQAAAAQQE